MSSTLTVPLQLIRNFPSFQRHGLDSIYIRFNPHSVYFLTRANYLESDKIDLRPILRERVTDTREVSGRRGGRQT